MKFASFFCVGVDNRPFCSYNEHKIVQRGTTRRRREMKIEINEYLLKLFHLVKDLGDIDFFWGKAKLSRTEFRILWEVANEQCEGRDIISLRTCRPHRHHAFRRLADRREAREERHRQAGGLGIRPQDRLYPSHRRSEGNVSSAGAVRPTSLQIACSRNSAKSGSISSSTKAGNFPSFAIGLPILPRRHNKG